MGLVLSKKVAHSILAHTEGILSPMQTPPPPPPQNISKVAPAQDTPSTTWRKYFATLENSKFESNEFK